MQNPCYQSKGREEDISLRLLRLLLAQYTRMDLKDDEMQRLQFIKTSIKYCGWINTFRKFEILHL